MDTSKPIILGSEVTPNRQMIVGRDAKNDFSLVKEGERLTITALGCGLAICAREGGELLSLQTADLTVWNS